VKLYSGVEGHHANNLLPTLLVLFFLIFFAESLLDTYTGQLSAKYSRNYRPTIFSFICANVDVEVSEIF